MFIAWGQLVVHSTISCHLAQICGFSFTYPICGRAQSGLGKNLVIDPILEEESYQDGSLMLTCMPSRYEVTQLTITGEWSTPKINEVWQSADLFLEILYVVHQRMLSTF